MDNHVPLINRSLAHTCFSDLYIMYGQQPHEKKKKTSEFFHMFTVHDCP